MRVFALALSILLLVGGFGWLLYIDWKIALAVGLIFWGNEINNRLEEFNSEG